MDLVRARRERTRPLRNIPRESSDFFPFGGGLNLIDSPLSVIPGQCQSALNYEMGLAGGYKRIGGYESFDGSASASEATYHLMRYGAIERQGILSRSSADTVDGAASSAAGLYLTQTEEGGHGQNAIENSDDYDNADWDNLQIAAADSIATFALGDIAATANYPRLNKLTEENIGNLGVHGIQMANGMTVNEGDCVYAQCYWKPGTRDGMGLFFENTAAAWGTLGPGLSIIDDGTPTLNNGLDFVNGRVGSKITNVGDGVWFIQWWTVLNDTTSAVEKIRFQLNDGTQGNYTGNGSHAWVGGIMAVVQPVFTPHNLVQGMDFSTWSAVSGTLTVTDKDLVPYHTNLFLAGATKLTDASSSPPETHRIRSTFAANLKPIKVKKGDKLFIEWYAAHTSGQIAIQTLTTDNQYDVGTFGGNSLTVYVDISNGTIRSDGQGGAWESLEVRLIATDRYRIQGHTIAATQDDLDGFGINIGHAVDNAGTTDISYTSTGLFSHIIGFKAISYSASIDFRKGHDFQYGYVTNATGENKYVDTGDLILGGVSGVFQDSENLEISATKFAESRSTATEDGESDSALDATYRALAVAVATAALKPPGSGPIRGVWFHEGVCYAFRDNVGVTQCDMWESDPSGWVQVVLNDVVHFDLGDGTKPSEGDTLDGVSSSASALIKRIVVTSGTFSGNDAVGYFVLGTVTGGPYTNNEVLNVSATRVADANGNSAVPTLAVGGRYEFRDYNFYGHADRFRMYGADGKNFAFEYDKGEGVFTQIETGMTTDTPTHLAAHNQHLFLAFPGGSLQLSGDGNPLSWKVITGAAELGVGDEITGLNEEVGNSLFIFTRQRSYVLQGNTRANFDLDDFNVNAGAHEWSLQRIGLGTFFDDRGFTTLLQTQRSGSVNFQENTQSELIQPLVLDLTKNTQVKCSHLIRGANIYRCYFSDGRIVSIGFEGHEVSGHMPVEYNFIANVACSQEDTDGRERVFAGADDGFVYELEKGTSFNGADLRAFIRTVLYHSKTPGQIKKYSQARIDATLNGALTLKGQFEYDFHDDDTNLADELDFSTDESGGYWDDMAWDGFVWDKPTSGIPQEKLEGEGVNIAAYLFSTSKIDESHTLRGVTLQWLPRRDDRRN